MRRNSFKLIQTTGADMFIAWSSIVVYRWLKDDNSGTAVGIGRAGLWIGAVGLVAYIAGRFAAWWWSD